MTRLSLIIILALGLVEATIISCSELNTEKKKINFSTIDLTSSDGWFFCYSIKLNSSGQYILKTVFGSDSVKYFQGNLPDSTFSNISAFADTLHKTNYDTLYDEGCLDCSSFQMIIKTPDKKQKVKVIGSSTTPFDKIENMLYGITRSKKNLPIDTSIEFESFKNFATIRMETIKLTPPEIKHN